MYCTFTLKLPDNLIVASNNVAKLIQAGKQLGAQWLSLGRHKKSV